MRMRETVVRMSSLIVLALGVSGAALGAYQLLYDVEYPAIGYSTRPPTDAIARLTDRLESGEASFEFEEGRGYLGALIRELGIDPSSQLLVYSKTSLQTSYIGPETPRAIYFGEDVYIAWEQGGQFLEVASMDPKLGPVFYTLDQDPAGEVRFERQMETCLRCHDSYSLTGGGVPRFILGSGLTDAAGQLVSHEGWILTSDQTPLRSRWGGWYVTGTHGDQVHLGNIVIRDPADLRDLDLSRTGNRLDLDGLVDTGPYLASSSDIVALMVIEHQVRLQNLLTRVGYETRSATSLDSSVLARSVEPLVEAMVFTGEAPVEAPIAGVSGFAERFASEGPHDSRGRSLRDLDLEKRLFRYPLSYLIYSEGFDALPLQVKDYVYRRLREILSGKDRSGAFAHLSEADRGSILEILRETKPDFASAE